mgnify:CR=1 FL=1
MTIYRHIAQWPYAKTTRTYLDKRKTAHRQRANGAVSGKPLDKFSRSRWGRNAGILHKRHKLKSF